MAGMDALFAALHGIAGSQHGVITRAQLPDAGVTSTGIPGPRLRGLDRFTVGVFRSAGSPATHL